MLFGAGFLDVLPGRYFGGSFAWAGGTGRETGGVSLERGEKEFCGREESVGTRE